MRQQPKSLPVLSPSSISSARLIEEQAAARGLPPMFLMRLIFKESRFDPKAVSPKGAQGIAQFMPGTAADRGLADPFEPKSAIVHSASLLADLKAQFGNIGLAAAAYNAGAERVRGWLAGRSKLPAETRGYVSFITGRPAEDWKLPETELPSSLKAPDEPVVESCRKLSTIVVRAVYETEPLTASGAWRPWGVHVSSSFSKAAALAQFARLKQRFADALANAEPFVVPQRNLSRGRRSLYTVQIGAESRKDAAETWQIAAAKRRLLHRAKELGDRSLGPPNAPAAMRRRSFHDRLALGIDLAPNPHAGHSARQGSRSCSQPTRTGRARSKPHKNPRSVSEQTVWIDLLNPESGPKRRRSSGR